MESEFYITFIAAISGFFVKGRALILSFMASLLSLFLIYYIFTKIIDLFFDKGSYSDGYNDGKRHGCNKY